MMVRPPLEIFIRFVLLGLALIPSLPVIALEPMTYIYHPPESNQDKRYLYHWEILKTALDKTKAEFGDYALKPSEFMTEARQARELKSGTGKLTVMYLSTTPDFEKNLIPIHIPVDKNLGGYCIFLIRQEDKDKFKSISSLEDLKKINFGLGQGWIDVEILKSNGLKVVTGSNYEGLFEMLLQKRFDVFLRAAIEITDEFDARTNKMPDLYIEESLILYYPLPMYFWFSKNEQGMKLAKRAELGMRKMILDGSYDRIFNHYQREKIERLKLKSRRIIKINNPNIGPEDPVSNPKLWFTPESYR